MPDARAVLKKMNLISSSKERDRRPTIKELESILSHYDDMKNRRKQEIDMLKIVGFALFSTRRLSEITRIEVGSCRRGRAAGSHKGYEKPWQQMGE